MINTIFKAFSNGFFRTIGRISAYVVLMLILAYLYEKGAFDIGGVQCLEKYTI